MIRRSILGLLLLTFCAPLAIGQDRAASLQSSIKTKLDALHAAGDFPGVSVGYVLTDGTTGALTGGFADLEKKTPLTPRHRLLAGSIGKTFVAATVLQMIEEGKFSLDDKASKWLGGESWFSRLPNAETITVRSLMNHTAGLGEYFEVKSFNEKFPIDPDKTWTPEELVAPLLDAKPLFEVGKGWSYADTNYIVLGMIAEKASGQKLFPEIERRLLGPLTLERTIASDDRTILDLAIGDHKLPGPFGFRGATIIDGKFVMNPQMEWAGGGFASTPLDLARWAKTLYEGKVFKEPKTLETMLTPVSAAGGRGGGPGNAYGLGVQIRDSKWGKTYGHEGWFPGYLSAMEYFPERKVAIAVQFNTDSTRAIKKSPRGLVLEIAEMLFADDAK
jgi:D-alanyl-D-alanine carboxypeptidase